ncbi:MAG TPA: hypothetical protein VEX62_02130 [Candidatus Limnocylindrales bacterium]|nr:hypothetical protein [Candidatus Limnocylindrales bacterium]
MRKRFGALLFAALIGAALVMPGAALAGHGIFYRIIGGGCSATEIGMQLRFVAKGGTEVNRLRVRGWVERKAPSSTTWERGFYHFTPVDYNYVADGTRHYVEIDWTYPNHAGLDERIFVHMQAYGPDGILWGGKVHTGKC